MADSDCEDSVHSFGKTVGFRVEGWNCVVLRSKKLQYVLHY